MYLLRGIISIPASLIISHPHKGTVFYIIFFFPRLGLQPVHELPVLLRCISDMSATRNGIRKEVETQVRS